MKSFWWLILFLLMLSRRVIIDVFLFLEKVLNPKNTQTPLARAEGIPTP